MSKAKLQKKLLKLVDEWTKDVDSVELGGDAVNALVNNVYRGAKLDCIDDLLNALDGGNR